MMISGSDLIAKERERQVSEEGWSSAHDDSHENGELAIAAACYATERTNACVVVDGHLKDRDAWPWDESWDKRDEHPRLKQLVIAGALIAAEIDRVMRSAELAR